METIPKIPLQPRKPKNPTPKTANILELIIQEIQDKTRLTLTPQKDIGNNPYYTITTPNTKIFIGLVRNSTRIFIFKTKHKHQVTFGSIKNTKLIDLNHPQSIEKIIQTIQKLTKDQKQ